MEWGKTSVLLMSIIVICFTGLSEGRSARGFEPRCLCAKVMDKFIHPSLLLKIELISESPGCRKVQIIATMKHMNKQICLDPSSGWGHTIKTFMKRNNKEVHFIRSNGKISE